MTWILYLCDWHVYSLIITNVFALCQLITNLAAIIYRHSIVIYSPEDLCFKVSRVEPNMDILTCCVPLTGTMSRCRGRRHSSGRSRRHRRRPRRASVCTRCATTSPRSTSSMWRTRSAAAPSPARPAHAAPTRRGEWWDRSTRKGWIVGPVQLGGVSGGNTVGGGAVSCKACPHGSNQEGWVVGPVHPWGVGGGTSPTGRGEWWEHGRRRRRLLQGLPTRLQPGGVSGGIGPLTRGGWWERSNWERWEVGPVHPRGVCGRTGPTARGEWWEWSNWFLYGCSTCMPSRWVILYYVDVMAPALLRATNYKSN